MSKNSRWYYDEQWVRQWRDDNIDWFLISEHLSEMSIDFCREFKDQIKWLWVICIKDNIKREDIFNEFNLKDLIEKYGDPE